MAFFPILKHDVEALSSLLDACLKLNLLKSFYKNIIRFKNKTNVILDLRNCNRSTCSGYLTQFIPTIAPQLLDEIFKYYETMLFFIKQQQL